MFKTNLKIAWRNITHHRSYTVINISGLSLGVAYSILIFTILAYHLSFEDFNNNRDRIYRIVTEVHSDNTFYSRGTPSPLAKAIRNDYTFAVRAVRIVVFWNTVVNIQTSNNNVRKFTEENGMAVTTSDFFNIFNFPLAKGSIKTALNEPNTAIITQKLAKKYFENEDAIGKINLYV
jgi:putative ABC transport system permease protein